MSEDLFRLLVKHLLSSSLCNVYKGPSTTSNSGSCGFYEKHCGSRNKIQSPGTHLTQTPDGPLRGVPWGEEGVPKGEGLSD